MEQTQTTELTREDVVRGYRLILAREPENETAIEMHRTTHATVEDLALALMQSEEGRMRAAGGIQPLEVAHPERLGDAIAAQQIISSFALDRSEPEDGYVKDFLGTRTRAYYSGDWFSHGGVVEPPPYRGSLLGDPFEWCGVLSAVRDAGEHLTGVEIDARWAPWTAIAKRAHVAIGGTEQKFVVAEDHAIQAEFVRAHLADNGIAEDAYTLHEAAVSTNAALTLQRSIDPTSEFIAEHTGGATVASRAIISLAATFEDFSTVDFLHTGLVPVEAQLILSELDILTEKARRVILRTGDRETELSLMTDLFAAGWTLEWDEASRHAHANGAGVLHSHGTQVWKNTNLFPATGS